MTDDLARLAAQLEAAVSKGRRLEVMLARILVRDAVNESIHRHGGRALIGLTLVSVFAYILLSFLTYWLHRPLYQTTYFSFVMRETFPFLEHPRVAPYIDKLLNLRVPIAFAP